MQFKLPAHHRLLLDAVEDPASTVDLAPADWELLLRVAWLAELLGFLAVELDRRRLLAAVPTRVANQLQSGLLETRKRQQLIRWELNRIHRALRGMGIPLIALKGMGYELAGLPSAAGRTFMDLDLLVPRANLDQAEHLLLQNGWRFYEISAYEEHFCRVWGREIPPLVHRDRATDVDIHYSITPVASRVPIDTGLLFSDAITGNDGKTSILGPVDMVTHCAVNLFQNNTLADGLRDLLDIDAALRTFSQETPEFWGSLIARAEQLGAGKPLFYSLYFSRLILRTPIPPRLEYQLKNRPGVLARRTMTALVPFALFPLHPDGSARLPRLARFGLFLRSLWINMPLHILLVHFAYRSYRYTRRVWQAHSAS